MAPANRHRLASRVLEHWRAAWKFEAVSHARSRSLLSAMIAAAAMAIPMLFANRIGHLGIGFLMALGALSANRSPARASILQRVHDALGAFVPTSLAAIMAAVVAAAGSPAALLVVVVAALSALVMRYSRPVAVATVRFIVFLVIFSTAIGASPVPWRLAAFIVLGAFWTALLVFTLSFLMTRSVDHPTQVDGSTVRGRLMRMRRELALSSTWDYPMRLALGLGLALAIRELYVSHHYSWVSVAVVLLTPRQFEMWPIKATQRFIGTLLGVIAAGLLLMDAQSLLVTLAVGLLAGLRSWYEERSYLLYTAVMAPLILCLVGGGHVLSMGLLFDRVMATLLGVLIVLASNALARVTTARPSPKPDEQRASKATAIS